MVTKWQAPVSLRVLYIKSKPVFLLELSDFKHSVFDGLLSLKTHIQNVHINIFDHISGAVYNSSYILVTVMSNNSWTVKDKYGLLQIGMDNCFGSCAMVKKIGW